MKKFFLFFIIFIFSASFSYANECKYQSKINSCTSALEAFMWKNNFKNIRVWWSLKDFTEFPCIQDSSENRTFQIAMDANFKKIDKDSEKYLKDIYDGTFGWDNNSFEDIESLFIKMDELRKNYKDSCEKSFEETLDCTKYYGREKPISSVSVLWALSFIKGSSWKESCVAFSDLKVKIFWEIAYRWFLLNKQKLEKDKKKEYTQVQRDNYLELSQDVRVNQMYIDRLNSKWTSKTKNTLNN